MFYKHLSQSPIYTTIHTLLATPTAQNTKTWVYTPRLCLRSGSCLPQIIGWIYTTCSIDQVQIFFLLLSCGANQIWLMAHENPKSSNSKYQNIVKRLVESRNSRYSIVAVLRRSNHSDWKDSRRRWTLTFCLPPCGGNVSMFDIRLYLGHLYHYLL